jgi:hypothetical protein
MPLSDILKEKIEYVASYVQRSTSNWCLIKKEIMSQMPGHLRPYVGFSKRHRHTKKMILNDIDKEAMNLWELLTGIKPIIDSAKLHDLNWVHRPKGWALNGGKEKILQAEAARKKE